MDSVPPRKLRWIYGEHRMDERLSDAPGSAEYQFGCLQVGCRLGGDGAVWLIREFIRPMPEAHQDDWYVKAGLRQ